MGGRDGRRGASVAGLTGVEAFDRLRELTVNAINDGLDVVAGGYVMHEPNEGTWTCFGKVERSR
jgi:hypothetical protein